MISMSSRIVLALLSFTLLTSAQQQQNNLRPLFDGKTLKGWTQCNGTAPYKIEPGGVLVGTTAEGSPNSFLCTDREYGDFILELETKFDPRLNSGVQVRSHRYPSEAEVLTFNGKQMVKRKHPAGRVHGYQVEISNAASGHSGGIYDEARRGWLHNIEADPTASKAIKDNEWNHYRIEARGDRIRTWVNGVPCADLVDSMDLTGFIALQVHQFKGDSPAQVRWRNIRIQDLGRHEWKSLFDGKTMNGWSKMGPGEWTIEDGAFHAKSVAGETATGFVIHDTAFRDATIKVQFQLTPTGDGNSGFFIRSDKKTHAGYEVEIDEKKGTGGLFEVGGRKWVTGPEDNAAMHTAPGQWNMLVASTHGDRIVFHLNGVKTLDLPNDTQGRKEGHIALQVHNRRKTEIRFKDIAVLIPAKR